MCHFKGLIFSKFLTKLKLKALSWIYWGICWGSNYVILSKLHGKGRWPHRSKQGTGVGDAVSEGLGDTCGYRSRLEVWDRHEPRASSPGRAPAEDVLTQQCEKTQSRGRHKPKICICEVWLQRSDRPPFWTQANLGDDKTGKEMPSNLFLVLSLFLQTSHTRILMCDEKPVLNRTAHCKR